jgi:hypothetical protein
MQYVLLFLAVFTTSAFATGFDLGGDKTYNTANQTNLQAVGVDVSNRITNDTRSAAQSYATGGSAYSAGGSAVSGGGQGGIGQAVSGGSNSNVDFNITSPKNTPAVFSGNVYPTTSCAHSSTLGGSGVGFGLALGTSWTDEECSLRETARSFQLLGKTEDAVHVLCVSKFASAAPTCKAIAPSQSAPRPEQQ